MKTLSNTRGRQFNYEGYYQVGASHGMQMTSTLSFNCLGVGCLRSGPRLRLLDLAPFLVGLLPLFSLLMLLAAGDLDFDRRSSDVEIGGLQVCVWLKTTPLRYG